MRFAAVLLAVIGLATPARATLDLNRAAVMRLDNGLTLLVLEEHSAPVVSVQMLYKVGGRDDPAGRMGLAHFFEHMAFRASKNFPGTRLVDDIYDAGGEWHGYTWIDQTTYFATAPAGELELLLRIEADRMGRLRIAEEDVKAEFGAVLAEMNQYENDPSSVLFDAVLAAAFPVHPYGKNTIGYEGDVAAITKADLDDFYERHIGPATAVLAVAGDVDSNDVAKRVGKLFGKAKRNAEPQLPPPAEPNAPALRRVTLRGASDEKLFKIAYPAPAASDPDYAAFLVLQALLGGSEGVNFRQSDWGVPASAKTPLGGVADNMTTWFIPTAQPYIFLVSGSAGAAADEGKIESALDAALAALREAPPGAGALAAAKEAVLRELILDVQTTEDAAHQLAYFEGVGALDQLLSLPAKVDAVTADDVAAAARRWLNPERRTIGWMLPGAAESAALRTPEALAQAAPRAGAPPESHNAARAGAAPLEAGAAAIIRVSRLSPTVAVKTFIAGRYDCDLCTVDDPPGYTSIEATAPARELLDIVAGVKETLATARPRAHAAPSSTDPAARLEELFADRIIIANAPAKPAPVLTVVAGDVDANEAAQLMAQNFPEAAPTPAISLAPSTGDIIATIEAEKSQAALGYMVEAPAMNSSDAMAWRLALYILTHEYGGRLGAEAISNQGLVYYIGSDYRPAGEQGLITLSIGVDPGKQETMAALLKTELGRLVSQPPSAEELAAAKRHLAGRRLSAAQSNAELADAIARQWLAAGGLVADEDFTKAVEAVTLGEIEAVLPAFAKGDIVRVRVKEQDQ